MQAAAADMTEDAIPNVREDIVAYDAMRPDLEASHIGKWALVYKRELINVFETFDAAARDAVMKFGKGPYLIRRIGTQFVSLPTSVMYGPMHAVNLVRV